MLGGYFQSDRLCCALDAVSGKPSERLGWDPNDDPRLLNFSFAFDVGVRRRASEVERRQLKTPLDNSEYQATQEEVAGEWLRDAKPDEIEALNRMMGV